MVAEEAALLVVARREREERGWSLNNSFMYTP
jgi:hypothetical protein